MKARHEVRTEPLFFILSLSCVFLRQTMVAQGPPPPPPPPPPLQPLVAPAAPAGNPVTADKTQLGKVLFWDEQLSSTRTVACGTCHQPVAGGSDPRSNPATLHPGPDGVFGSNDDIVGSPGVVATGIDGLHELDDFFGMAEQVTGRTSPSAINAGHAPELFWDGRAGGTFRDPVSGQVVLASGAALESQAAGPPTSDVEMAHSGRDWAAVASRLRHAIPLALSPSVPADLSGWIADRSYEALFEAAFGSPGITPARILLAVATYERSLVSNQAPFDAFIAGNPNALTAQERLGLDLFRTNDCVACHGGNRLTDDRFHYIGVRPQADDPGRLAVTGNNADRGRMKTPTLRNVALRGRFMHNGRLSSLAEVVDFYDRGGDFDAPNKNVNIRPLGLTGTEKAALVAFLGRPLTDPRVAAETGPFSRPALAAGSPRQPVIGEDVVGDGTGNLPRMTAVEPALAGSWNFTVGLSRVPVGSTVWLAVDDEPIPSRGGLPEAMFLFSLTAQGGTAWDGRLGERSSGFASVSLAIPGGPEMRGRKLFGKWFVPGEDGWGESASFETTVFGGTAGLLAAPSSVTASEDDPSGRVELAWNAVAGATRYDIYRGPDESFAGARHIGSSATNAFSDAEVEINRIYRYWVVSVNADEASAPSGVATGSTFSPDGFLLTASDGVSTSATNLSWEAQEGVAIYRIFRGTTDSPAEMELLGETDSLLFEDISGTPLRPYHYRIEGVDGEGRSVLFSRIDPGFRRLAAPTDPAASDGQYTDRIALAWTASAEAESYAVFRSVDGGAEILWRTTAGTSLDDTEAIPGQTVAYSVQSRNTYGGGDTTSRVFGRRAFAPVTGLTAVAGPNPGEVRLAWTAVEGAARYAILRGLAGNPEDAEEIARTEAVSFVDTTAEAGLIHHYWIAALDAEGRIVSFDESVTAAALAGSSRPDLLIRDARGTFLGNGIHNRTGAGQTRFSVVPRHAGAIIRVRAENDGSVTDTLRYSSAGASPYCRVTCISVSPRVRNLTAAMATGTARSVPLDPGATETLEIRVTPVLSAAARRVARYQLVHFLRASSGTEPARGDTVKLILNAR